MSHSLQDLLDIPLRPSERIVQLVFDIYTPRPNPVDTEMCQRAYQRYLIRARYHKLRWLLGTRTFVLYDYILTQYAKIRQRVRKAFRGKS